MSTRSGRRALPRWARRAQWLFGALCPLLFWDVEPAASADLVARDEPVIRGRELFTRAWIPRDPRSRGGDGLGPMYNDTSCLACHSLGGIGGGGASGKNVQILVPVTSGRDQREEAAQVHPVLRIEPFVVLHRYSTQGDYAAWRQARLERAQDDDALAALLPAGARLPAAQPAAAPQQAAALARRAGAAGGNAPLPLDVSVRVEERNTTAVFGAGLIDAIPTKAIVEEARRQTGARAATAGRAAVLPDGSIGRFGWKAQRATLEQFVLGACALELGLQIEGHLQATPPHVSGYRGVADDMNRRDADDLVAFVRAIPAPQAIQPARLERFVADGGKLFHRVGCDDCHRPSLGSVAGVYSDLLLHEMGSSLSSSGSYYGVSSSTPPVAASRPPSATEWRTPPLWGCRDSAPYLHDGRAATLQEAIEQHGGQGAASATAFKQLSAVERQKLLSFLESLAAPAQPDPAYALLAKRLE